MPTIINSTGNGLTDNYVSLIERAFPKQAIRVIDCSPPPSPYDIEWAWGQVSVDTTMVILIVTSMSDHDINIHNTYPLFGKSVLRMVDMAHFFVENGIYKIKIAERTFFDLMGLMGIRGLDKNGVINGEAFKSFEVANFRVTELSAIPTEQQGQFLADNVAVIAKLKMGGDCRYGWRL